MSHSLQEHVDADYIADSLLLEKDNVPLGMTLLVVEGQDDKTVFSKFVSKEHCKISVENGKNNLIQAIEKHNKLQKKGLLAITDSDFDMILGKSLPINVLSTDGYNLETMILSTEALEEYVHTTCKSENEIQIERFKPLLRTKLFKLGSLIGYLRLKSQQCAWGLTIHIHQLLQSLSPSCELPFSDVIDYLKNSYPEIDVSSISLAEYGELSERHLCHMCDGKDINYG